MKKRVLFFRFLAALCALGLVLSASLFLRQWQEYRAGEASYQALAQAVVSPPPSPSVSPEQTGPAPQEDPEQPRIPLQVDFQALLDINPQAVGWLYCPDTVISYPVAQGENNSYYLTHLFDGTPNSAGSLFLDSGCEGLEGKNSVIYGHYMKNGTLFGTLEEYQAQDYYQAHPLMYLLTPQGTLTIRLFSAYIAGPEDGAWQLTFSSEEDYGTWLEERKALSLFDSSVTPTPSDRVITLSTCAYTFPNARFICHGLAEELT